MTSTPLPNPAGAALGTIRLDTSQHEVSRQDELDGLVDADGNAAD